MSNWLADKQEIEERLKKGRTQPNTPSSLSLDEITVMDTVFQHRKASEWASESHVKALLRSLRNTAGKPFDPLTVMWAGDTWVLIDGHHRYKAYQEYEFDEPVPVNIFQGTIDEALGEALRANVQDKLPMTAREKINAAWRLVVGANLSINQTAQLSLASRATVLTMRKVRDALAARTAPGYLGQLDWSAARAKYAGLDTNFDTINDWQEKKARLIAEKLKKTFGKELSKFPKVLWMALEKYDSNLLYAFCMEHGINPEVLEGRYAVMGDDDDDADF
jgi:hypothetical protein